MRRYIATVLTVVSFLGLLGAGAANAATSCALGFDTCQGPMLITDHPNYMGTVFGIEDNEGNPPGKNSLMLYDNGYEFSSTNPICSVSAHPVFGHQICIGGAGPGNGVSGGTPVLALSPDNGKTWLKLTPGLLKQLIAMVAIAKARGWHI